LLPDWLRKLLQKLGVNTVRLEWKIRYWQQRRQNRRSRLETFRQTIGYKHKYCDACGSIVDRNATVCPICGSRVGSRRMSQIKRSVGLILPGAGGAWIGFLCLILAVFLVEVRMAGLNALFGRWSPELHFALIRLGALLSPNTFEGQYWRLLTAGLLHANLIHIAFNAIALSQLSPPLEEEIGTVKFIVLLTAAQLGCALVSYGWHVYTGGRVFSVGASGIAFGLIGFGLAHTHRMGIVTARAFYVQWAVYGLLFGLMAPGLIDNAGHVGGLLAGAAFAWWRPMDDRGPSRHAELWLAVAILCLLAWGYALIAMILSARAGGF
jgi:rhomboid protease GluP